MVGLGWGLWVEAERELGQGVARVAFGWLGSAVNRRQYLECGGQTGNVAWRSDLRKEGHNMGREGNEGETGGNW